MFVTTKLWETEWGYCQASSSIQERLASLDLGYIDLLLLHTPGDPALRPETWKALEEAQEQVHFMCLLQEMKDSQLPIVVI